MFRSMACAGSAVVRRDDHFDQQQLALRGERAMAISEQPCHPLVVPVVDDLLQRVEVGPLRHRLEEVTAHQLAPLREPLRGDGARGRRDDVGAGRTGSRARLG